MTIAVFAAPFDPIHNGHLDVAIRAARLFDKLYIGIQTFPGMVAVYAQSVGAKTLVRALRMTSDFELEFEKALMSKSLYPELDLVCLMTSEQYQFLSSRMLKEVAIMGGDLSSMVPDNVARALRQKVLERKIA